RDRQDIVWLERNGRLADMVSPRCDATGVNRNSILPRQGHFQKVKREKHGHIIGFTGGLPSLGRSVIAGIVNENRFFSVVHDPQISPQTVLLPDVKRSA